jgi:HD-GYP domain-containing protein (c-di-GMP phosphodiesterase class II)
VVKGRIVGETVEAGDAATLRLAELIAALSLGIDLGFGQPMEHVLRQCIIALRLGEQIGLDEQDRSVVYYTAMLVNVACHSDAHEQAKWFGDDIALKSGKYQYSPRSVGGAAATMRMLGAGNPMVHRFRLGLEFAISGYRDLAGMIDQHAALARQFAGELGLPDAVQIAVGSAYEQWDGKGWPGEYKGEAVPIAARIGSLAEYIEVAHRIGGVTAAIELARKRSGSQFDPNLASELITNSEAILGGLDKANSWESVIDAEPTLNVVLSGDGIDAALSAVADFVDLKSPYTLGHARAVTELVNAAGTEVRLSAEELRLLRRAGLVHGLGRLGVSNSIWDKAGALGTGERERVRLHPQLTERMLRQSPSLAPLGDLAGQLRERLDGSGYPRGLSGPALGASARILGAADAYQAMLEPRPYRDPLPAAGAASELRAEVRAGRLDGQAVEAVLVAAGHRASRRREGPAGLTAREIDVLGLLARGLSSKEIATRLVISPKTARNHIEHIYTKIGATSRVTASLFAMQHGLLAAGPATS